MIERALRKSDRDRIRKYARERWESRLRHDGKMSADTASLIQQDVFRYIRRTKVGGGIFSAILIKIAMTFAAALIRKWLENWLEDNERR